MILIYQKQAGVDFEIAQKTGDGADNKVKQCFKKVQKLLIFKFNSCCLIAKTGVLASRNSMIRDC